MTARHTVASRHTDPSQAEPAVPDESDPYLDPVDELVDDWDEVPDPADGETPRRRTNRRGLIAAVAGAGAFAAACSRIVATGGKGGGGGAAVGGARPTPAPKVPKAAKAAAPGSPMRGGGAVGEQVALAGRTTPKSMGAAGAGGAAAVPTGQRQPASSQGAAVAQAPVAPPLTTPPFLKERPALVHLLSRVTYGVTPDLVADATKLGANAWLEQQLAPAKIDDSQLEGYLAAAFPLLTRTAAQLRAMENTTNDQQMSLAYATEARMIWSKKQVYETMVDFFRQHLNVVYPGDDNWQESIEDDLKVWRPLALGKYSALLSAVAKAPSMLRRLNNDQNTKDASNENWGREVLELYAVGVNAGYTQHDVVQCAKVFTGWSIQYDDSKPGYRQFQYQPNNHFVGPVKVLGWSNANTDATRGMAVGESLLTYLAHHPMTAQRIATKLAIRFVSDTPPKALVDRLAKVYLQNDTAIVPVLRALFASAEFKASVGVKTLRPLEDIIRTMRVLGVKPPASGQGDLDTLYYTADGMGMAPLKWSFPNGYPDTQSAWSGAGGLLARFNMQRALAGGWWKDFTYTPLTDLLGAKPPTTAGAFVDTLARRFFFQRLAGPHRADLLAYLGATATTPVKDPEHPSPAVSLDLLVSMLLHSPYFELR